MGKTENEYKILVGKAERKKIIARSGHK